MKNVWRNFVIIDDTLCRHKFNYYSGWQPVLDCLRAQNCLTRIGRFIKGIEILPSYNFNNIAQFMVLLTFNIQQSRKPGCENQYFEVGKRIQTFKYVFPCNMTNSEQDVKLYGTGGSLLKTLKCLMVELNKLRNLKLINLMLERYEAKHLLDEVLESCQMVIQNLCLVNVTSTHCPIMHVGLFLNLKVLIISPQNLDDDVLQLISSTAISDFYIFQNNYSPNYAAACSEKAWKNFRRDNPKTKVHLRVESATHKEVILQPSAPIYSITYRTPKNRAANDIIKIIDLYKYTISTYGHESVPDFNSSLEFDERIDNLLILMARQCPNLRKLTIREPISTSSLLLLAKIGINLIEINILKSVVVERMDWPKNPEWTDDFYDWLKIASSTIESTEKEISEILRCRWTMMSNECFDKFKISLSGFSL